MKPAKNDLFNELSQIMNQRFINDDNYDLMYADLSYPIPIKVKSNTETDKSLREFFLYDHLPPFPEKFTYDKNKDPKLIAPENEKDKKEILFNQKNKLKRNLNLLQRNSDDNPILSTVKKPKIDKTVNPFTMIPRENPFLENINK